MDAQSTSFKMSECEDASIIVNLVVFFTIWFPMPSCRSAGEAVQGSLTCLHLSGYQSKIILLILIILNNVNVEINCMHTSSQNQLFSLTMA